MARRGLCIQRATNGDSGQNEMPFLDQRLSYAMGFSDGDKQVYFHSSTPSYQFFHVWFINIDESDSLSVNRFLFQSSLSKVMGENS